MKIKVIYNSKIAKYLSNGCTIITLKDKIYVKGNSISPEFLNHELIHVCQQRELGFKRFLIEYALETAKQTLIAFDECSSVSILNPIKRWKLAKKIGYYANKFEFEAYSRQKNFNYINEKWPSYQFTIEYENEKF